MFKKNISNDLGKKLQKLSFMFEFWPGNVGAGYNIDVGGESVVGQAVLPRNISAFGKPKLRSFK